MSFPVVDAGLRTRLLSLMLVVAMAASLLVAPPGAMADDRDPAQLALACPDPLPDAPFNDVAAGNVHDRAIACLVAYGVTEGQGPNTYGPTTTVVRAQMATFLARLLSQTDTSLPSPASPVFSDVDGVHADNIEALAATGIVPGTSATTFSPGGEVNRAQMASFLMRATDLMVAAGVTSPPYLDGDDADNGVPEDDDAAERPAPEPGVATGECRDPEVLLQELGSIEERGAVRDYELEVAAGQRITFRPDDFGPNIRWALLDVFEEAVFSSRGNSHTVTFSDDATYTLRLSDDTTAGRSGLGDYRFSVLDVTDE